MNFDDITPEVFSIVCRTCLQNKNEFISIFDSKAAEMLSYCEFCQISSDDGLPNQICVTCLEMLEQSFRFKETCRKADEKLKSVVNNAFINSNTQSVDSRIVDHENSLDSTDLRDELKNENSNYELFINTTNQISERIVDDDLISFLDKPLPPPLPYQCAKCPQSFTDQNDLNIHQSVHTPNLTCLVCSKHFNVRRVLKRHLKIHLSTKSHVCNICNKTFSESHSLTKHLRQHSGIPREKKHFCVECGQRFSEPYYLRLHMRKHTGERPFVCSDCGKSFADPRSHKKHIMMHTGEKPFSCNFCMKRFVQNANLTKHLRVHTGEKPYVCKMCMKSFSQSSSLDKHLRTHVG